MSMSTLDNMDSGTTLGTTMSHMSSSPFINQPSAGSLKRTYLVCAAKLKMERHGQVAESISKCDLQADALDHENKRLEAFAFKERALVMRQKLYGPSHPVVTECAKELGLQYSIVAMDLVRAGDHVESLKLIEKAEVVTASSVLFPDPIRRKQLLAVMYNNFGCYYKFLGKFHTALKFLQKALKIESSVPGCQNPAGTHLNVCALLSQMGRHRSALHHAQLATHLLQAERDASAARRRAAADASAGATAAGAGARSAPVGDMQAGEGSTPREAIHAPPSFERGAGEAGAGGEGGDGHTMTSSASGQLLGPVANGSSNTTTSTTDSGSEQQNRTCLIIIALYNGAVEMEHIGCYEQAVEQYEYALKIAKDELGDEHSLTDSVRTTLKFARRAARKAARLNVMNQTSRDRDADLGLTFGESGSSGESLKVTSSSQTIKGTTPRSPPPRMRSSAAVGSRSTSRMPHAPHRTPSRVPSTPAMRTPAAPPSPAQDATWSATGGFARTKSTATVRPHYGAAGAHNAASKASLPARDATWSASTSGMGGRQPSMSFRSPASVTREIPGSRQSRRVVEVVGSKF